MVAAERGLDGGPAYRMDGGHSTSVLALALGPGARPDASFVALDAPHHYHQILYAR